MVWGEEGFEGPTCKYFCKHYCNVDERVLLSHCGTYNNESIIVCLKIQSLEVTVAAFQLLAARLLIRQ